MTLAWWLVRASGFTAYLALAALVLSGLAVPSKSGTSWLDRKLLFATHEELAAVAVGFAALHAVASVVDGFAPIPAWALLIPGVSPYRTAGLALGTLAGWGLLAVAGSSWLKKQLSPTLWRFIHVAAFGTVLLGAAHGLATGTDDGPLARGVYAATGLMIVAGTGFRLLVARPAKV